MIAAEPCEPHEEDSEIPNQTAQEAVIHSTASVSKHSCAFIWIKTQYAVNLPVILSFSIMLGTRSLRSCFLLDPRPVSLSLKAPPSASDAELLVITSSPSLGTGADICLRFFLVCVSAAPPADSEPQAPAVPGSDLVTELSQHSWATDG